MDENTIKKHWKQVLPTVDIAIVNEWNKTMLLVRKENQTLLRFVGGFADVDSPSYEHDAIREAVEETNIELSSPVYIGSTLIDDYRYRNKEDKIKTLFFYCQYFFGDAKASDDIVEVRWVDMRTLKETDIVEEHRPLFKMFVEWYNERDKMVFTNNKI